MTPRWLGAAGLALLLTAAPAARPAAAQSGFLNPAPVRTFSFDGGYGWGFGAAGTDQRYYRFSYSGKMVREEGTPFSAARHLDLLAPQPAAAGGDVPGLAFRFEDGVASAGGALLEALGAEELPFPGLTALGLRGTALVAADDGFDHVTAAVGLESPPARIPGLGRSGISNWIVVGLNGERREATDSAGGDATVALATFRSFVGAAVGWRRSAEPGRVADKIVADLMAVAPTLAAASATADSIRRIPANRRTPLQQLVLDAVGDAGSDADWGTLVRELSRGTAEALVERPTLALYAEWSGWVDLASEPEGERFRSLFTATVDYWPLPSRDDILFRARYENGYERGAPGVKRHQVLATVGVRF